MDTKKSFEKAIKEVKTAGFNRASQQLKAYDIASELLSRNVDLTAGLDK